jgi:CheY-like chemotaxis protein
MDKYCVETEEKEMDGRILVVDDNVSLMDLLRRALTGLGAGYGVETACSGDDALARMAVQSFDLLITDLCMPGMDGLELMHRTRQSYPQTRLILMTADGSEEVRAAARRLRVAHHLAKPFSVTELLDAARGALEGPVGHGEDVLIPGHSAFLERLPSKELAQSTV